MNKLFYPNKLNPIFFKPKNSENYIKSLENLLKKEFGIDKIEKCHEMISPKRKIVLDTDQRSVLHKVVYKDFDKKNSEIVPEYYKICKEMIEHYKSLTGIKSWAVQRFPSMRFHWPNNIAVFEFHKDSDYSHSTAECNNIFFFTKSKNTNAIWFEQTMGCKDYAPLNAKKGQIAILNSAIYSHGNKINKEGWTRVSSDFRIIPIKAVEKGSKTLIKKKKLDLTDYFIDAKKLFN